MTVQQFLGMPIPINPDELQEYRDFVLPYVSKFLVSFHCKLKVYFLFKMLTIADREIAAAEQKVAEAKARQAKLCALAIESKEIVERMAQAFKKHQQFVQNPPKDFRLNQLSKP